MDLKKKLENEKNVILVKEFEYKEKKYAMTIKILDSGIKYVYYEIDDENIINIIDEELLKDIKEIYEINEDVIY